MIQKSASSRYAHSLHEKRKYNVKVKLWILVPSAGIAEVAKRNRVSDPLS